jgi:hypothetical protein
MMLPGALTGRLSCGCSETGQTNRPSSAAANLIPHPNYHIYFLSEKESFSQMKRQQAQSRMVAIRRAHRSPAAAAA